MSAGRLGNDMFVYASLIGIAARNQMVPIYKCDALSNTFQVTATGQYVLEPPTTNIIEESAFRYDVCSHLPLTRKLKLKHEAFILPFTSICGPAVCTASVISFQCLIVWLSQWLAAWPGTCY